MVIRGLKEGRGRKFNGKRFQLGTTSSKKTIAKEDAEKIRRRGFKARVVPIKIGYGVFFRK